MELFSQLEKNHWWGSRASWAPILAKTNKLKKTFKGQRDCTAKRATALHAADLSSISGIISGLLSTEPEGHWPQNKERQEKKSGEKKKRKKYLYLDLQSHSRNYTDKCEEFICPKKWSCKDVQSQKTHQRAFLDWACGYSKKFLEAIVLSIQVGKRETALVLYVALKIASKTKISTSGETAPHAVLLSPLDNGSDETG